MKSELTDYLKDLKAYGVENDIPNVTDEVGRFLNMLIQIKSPKTILEIGCANGYSTIWMAEAAEKVGAKVHTVDHSAPTFEEARTNVPEAGFGSVVQFHFGDARQVVPAMDTGLVFDFVFVDGQKANYRDFWDTVLPRLTTGAVIVFDDMLAFPEKTKSFHDYIKGIEGFDQLLIPIDEADGILVLVKN